MTGAEMRQWRAGWKALAEGVWRDLCARNPTQNRREAFQLLAAATAYHINGVREFPDELLHVKAVPASRSVPWDATRYRGLFASAAAPPFGPRVSRQRAADYYGGMHLSSASLRLPTVVYLLGQEIGSCFAPYLGTGDIDRRTLKTALDRFSARCCPFPPPPQARQLAYYLAVVVAERDRLGHGAESTDSGWRREREVAFSRLNQCQLVEAQLSLLRLAVDDFRKLGG